MKTFTTYAEKKAKQILNLLQGYTKGIRITAILILLLMGVNNAWSAGQYNLNWKGKVYFLVPEEWDISAYSYIQVDITRTTSASSSNYQYYAGTMTRVGDSRLYYLTLNADHSGWNQNEFIAFTANNHEYGSGTFALNGNVLRTKPIDYGCNNANNFYLFKPNSESNFRTTTNDNTMSGDWSNSRDDLVKKKQTIDLYLGDTKSDTGGSIEMQGYYFTSNTAIASSSLTSSSSSVSYDAVIGTEMTLIATPKAGYSFVGWYDGETLLSSKEEYTYCVYGTKTITARFKENTYSVTISAGTGGTVSPSGSKTIGQVTKTTVTANPNANYEFVNWTATGGVVVENTSSASTTITATAAGTLTANFRSTATNSLTVVAGAGIESVAGSIEPITLGSTYDIEATPKTGYTFSTWTAEPAANATFESATTANTTVTVNNGSVTVTASATENMSTLTTSNQYDAGAPGYAVPTASVNSIGYETTATVTATPAGNGYTFTGWTLTNCTRTDGGASDATSITVRSNGDGKAATVVANYAEDLTSTYYVLGDNAGPFSEGWNANQNTMMKKHSGNANSNDVYWEIDVPQSKVTPNDNQWEFKIYNEAGSDDNTKWFGWGSGDTYYWLTKENNSLTLSTSGSNNIRFKPYLAGKYTFHLNYNDSSKPTLEVTWPVYNQLRISAANPADATNTGDFDMTGSGTYTVTRSLNANTTYTFKIVYDSEWYGANSGNLTRASSSKTLSTSSNNLTLITDVAGDYTFTFNSSNKNLSVTYPEAYTVTYSRTPTAAADAPTTNPSITSGNYVAAGTSVTFTAKTAKTGYTFKGWYDNNTGTGAALSTNLAYTCTINANTTIYAVYTVNTYNINIVANPTEAAESLTTSPQSVGVEKVNISTTAKFTYKFDNWTATDGITITEASNPSTSITATKAGTVTANFTQLQPTTVYLKPNTEWKQSDARFAIHYWHDGQPAGWVDMTDVGCNRDYFVATIPAGYTNFLFARMDPSNTENKWEAGIDWNKTGDLTIPTDGKNLFTLPTSGNQVWNGATGTWGTYTPPTYTITINAPEVGSIAVTVGGNTTTVTDTPKQITNIAAGTTFTIAYTPNAGFELGHSEVEGIEETYDGEGTYTVCGPVYITAHFVTKEEQVVYLRPNDDWLKDKAIFYAYVFNRYGDDEWIELVTKETDYTGAFGGTIPAGYSDVIFVRLNPNGTDNTNNKINFHNAWNQTVDYPLPADDTNNRFIIGEEVTSGSDKDKYKGSWEASDTPIYGIPGDWQGTDTWAADQYPLMGPDGEVTVNITQTNDTLGFKVYQYPYGSNANSEQWLGNDSTMVRGGEGVHEGGWPMETDKNNCGLGVDIAGDYVFHFNIRESKLTVQYPPMPVPSTITPSAQRIFEDAPLDWIAGNGTEANPYQLYVDETARITITGLADVPGLMTCYRVGDNEEQTSNIIDFTNILTEDTAYTVYAYYKNAAGATSDTVTVQTPYIKGLPMPFYLMTSPSQEINIDRIAAGENILVQFRSDAAATVGLYLQINDGVETKLTDITNTISTDYTHDVDDNIEPCILRYIARSAATVHGRTFEAKADVAIYKNVIIKVHDPDGWVKNAYMWRDYSDAVLTQWPGEPVLQNFGTWRVFSVKYPYYDRFIVNDGNAGNSTQTIDWVLPDDDTCYELLEPASNGSSDPADTGKYGLQEAGCPENLLVEDIKDTTIMEGEQIVVMPKIYVGLGYQVADIEASVSYDAPTSIKAMMSGTNVTILGNAEGESNVTVTYILDNVRIEKTFTVTVTKKNKITIQVKVPIASGGTYDNIGWSNNDLIKIHYWFTGKEGDIPLRYVYEEANKFKYLQAEVPLDAEGKTNFLIGYDDINENWEKTADILNVETDGCYTLKNAGWGNSPTATLDGIVCWDENDYAQYQVKILMGNGKAYTSNIVNAPEDTLSFFAPGMNETGYKAGVVMLYQNDKMIATIEPSNFTASDVYIATLNDALNGLDNVSTYSGNFYIRTYGTSHANIGFNNGKGWNSIKDLTAVEKDSVRFTKFTSREGEFYNHYWVQAMNTGNYGGKDVSACVANEYNNDLAGKLTKGKGTDEYGDIKVDGTGTVINVRFGYDPRTNYFGRAIIKGSGDDNYLNIHCDNAYKDKNCSTKLPYGTSGLENKMQDISNWVYQRDIYVPITNSKPSSSLYIEATSPSTTMKNVKDHLLGYVTNEITGEATTTPIQKTVIGSGTTNGTYLIRVVYDFKTNRLIAAWVPQGTIEVSTEKTINADVLFVRKENEDVPQINLSNQGKIKSLESMFFAMELHRIDKDPANRQVEQYWFTLPFDCEVGSISGVHGYLQIWGIQRYRGDLRAQKGWYAETPTFWEWMDIDDVMHAGEGYLLVFDKKNAPWNEIDVDKTDANGNIIEGQKDTISLMRLYFPSTTSGFDMQQQSEEQLTRTYENHTCTLTLHDRYLQDSNWKVIGTTSYNNAGITGYTVDTNPEYEELSDAPSFRYSYDYKWENGKFTYEYTPEDGKNATYNSFFGYMVQFAGTITWQPIMSETVPEGIAARRYVPANERTSFTTRLEIANAEGEKQDQTFVALDEKATTTFDQNKDLNKVMNNGTNIYTFSEGIPFAGNTLPMEKATVPVGLRIATAGEYTFRMPDGTDGISVTLVDNVTGTHTDMLMDEYTITLDAGTCENRFYLVVDPDRTATSVENVGEEAKGEEAKDQIKKFLIDGKLFIRTADGTFDAKGQRM